MTVCGKRTKRTVERSQAAASKGIAPPASAEGASPSRDRSEEEEGEGDNHASKRHKSDQSHQSKGERWGQGQHRSPISGAKQAGGGGSGFLSGAERRINLKVKCIDTGKDPLCNDINNH